MKSKNPLIMIILSLVLVGCGQTGPLYLPSEQPESQQTSSNDILGLR